MQTVAQKLCELVDKKYILFTSRGNTAIKIALAFVKKNHKKVLIQDQGGWLTYHEFIKKAGLEKIELKTDYGLVNQSDFSKHKGTVLLINSMPGYASLQDMEETYNQAKKNDVFVINDVSGSIGTDEAMFGDLIIGSFGHAKPLDIGEGGFIATDDEKRYDELCKYNEFVPNNEFLDALKEKLDNLDERLSHFELTRQEIIEDMHSCDIIHQESKGINVIVKFNNEKDKSFIVDYCKNGGYEFTECPRYIRVNTKAISIEVKRLYEEHSVKIDEEYDEDD